MEKYIILKLSDKDTTIPFQDRVALKERANGSWRISMNRLYDVNKAILLFRGRILEEYIIKENLIYNKQKKRVTFDLEIFKNSDLKGKYIDYKVPNPITTLTISQINKKIKKEN